MIMVDDDISESRLYAKKGGEDSYCESRIDRGRPIELSDYEDNMPVVGINWITGYRHAADATASMVRNIVFFQV